MSCREIGSRKTVELRVDFEEREQQLAERGEVSAWETAFRCTWEHLD
jgi:hypothetical protein